MRTLQLMVLAAFCGCVPTTPDGSPDPTTPLGQGTSVSTEPTSTTLTVQLSGTTASLTWIDVASETHYVVERYTPESGWHEYETLAANATSYLDEHIGSTQTCYRLRVQYANGEFITTFPVCITVATEVPTPTTTPEVPPTPPTVPPTPPTPTPTPTPPASESCASQGDPANATLRDMFTALNRWRVQNGLSEVAYSVSLEQAANAHAKDMYLRNFFSHTNPDGQGPIDRANTAGFCTSSSRAVGENIAWNQQSVTEVQTGWQNSPGHNANMLRPEFEYVGMGYYNSPNGPYWVQVFGYVK